MWRQSENEHKLVHRAFLVLFKSARRYHTEERMIYCDAEMNESIWRLDSHDPPWHDRIPAVTGRRTGPPGGGED